MPPPKSDIAEHIRKKSYEEERIRLAEFEGKEKARLEYEHNISKLNKITSEPTKPKWQQELQVISNVIDSTFSPSTKAKNKKLDNDGISPTFKL